MTGRAGRAPSGVMSTSASFAELVICAHAPGARSFVPLCFTKKKRRTGFQNKVQKASAKKSNARAKRQGSARRRVLVVG